MRMSLDANEALRLAGWQVFRSASRDRLIPGTGAGAALRRIKIGEALPAAGVFEGVAISLDERAAIAAVKAAGARRGEVEAPGVLSETQYLHYVVNTPLGAPGVVREDVFVLGVAPFDGFVTEVQFTNLTGPADVLVAVRTSGGQTFVSTFNNTPVVPGANRVRGDFFNPFRGEIAGPTVPITIFRGQMPVRLGEEIIFASSCGPGVPVLGNFLQGFIGIQSGTFPVVTGARVRLSAERALAMRGEEARRELQQQVMAVSAEGVKVTEEAKRVVAAEERFGRRAGVAKIPQAAPPPKPAAKFPTPKREPLEGADKTFVSAWNPSFGSIGYLIPNPPVGGRVNVFDSRYSVFDITGKLIAQGAIEPVRSDGEIPPGARISPVRGGIKSPAMNLDTLESLT